MGLEAEVAFVSVACTVLFSNLEFLVRKFPLQLSSEILNWDFLYSILSELIKLTPIIESCSYSHIVEILGLCESWLIMYEEITDG